MSEGFAKDSKACAACIAWNGERTLSHSNTLAAVLSRQTPGECRAPASPNYRKVTRAFFTCSSWAPMAMLRSHGGLPEMAPRAHATAAPPPVAEPAEQTHYRSRLYPLDRSPAPVAALYEYWLRRKGERALPDRRLIRPWELKGYLGWLSLIEAAPGGRVLVWRMLGSRMASWLPLNPVGRSLHDIGNPELSRHLHQDLVSCLESGRPECLLVQTDLFASPESYFQLALPLAESEHSTRATFLCLYTHPVTPADYAAAGAAAGAAPQTAEARGARTALPVHS